jgi:PmbA protein
MNLQRFFDMAKAAGIDESQLQIGRSRTVSVSLYHGEIENCAVDESQAVFASGIYHGKLGTCQSQRIGAKTFEYLVNGIKRSASVNESENLPLFPGSPKYVKKNIYEKSLREVPLEEKIALIREVEKRLSAYDSRISEVLYVTYGESCGASAFYNSHGLKLRSKGNLYTIYAAVSANDEGGRKIASDIAFGTKLSEFDIDDFTSGLGKRLISKLGAKPCPSKEYKTVLDKRIFGALVNCFLTSASAEEVQLGSSFLKGKLGEKVASSIVTIEERPLDKNVFFSYFDDEGVAKKNKKVVQKGVLQTYFHNRLTASKDGVEPTGNGSISGDGVSVSFGNIYVHGRRKSFEQMIAPIKEGIYITGLDGLSQGLSLRSGDFHCKAEGFMIRNGVVAEPVSMITITGNLPKMMLNVRDLDNDTSLQVSATRCPDAYVGLMPIGGE